MKKYGLGWSYFLLSAIFLIQQTVVGHNYHPPRLVVVIVVDQFAHAYMDKLRPYLKHGLRYLAEHGVYFTNAFQDNGQPGTATGHACLNTGTSAKDHGFVSNSWYENGEKVVCDADDSPDALVINPRDGTTYDYGKSAKRLMVDGLSNQCVLQSKPNSIFSAYSISGKSRSAIASIGSFRGVTAGSRGGAVWFDSESGMFTSSKAYFDELPEWLQEFNRDNAVDELGSIMWKRMYPESPYAYNFFNINNYEYTGIKKSMIDRLLPVPDETGVKNKYHFFEKTPQANQLILDCAQECIKTHVSRKHKDRLLLWVCLSPLDKLTHEYGPHSMEAIDMVYHLDRQIRRFIRQTLRTIGKHEVIFALTADHAVVPVPELLHDEGLTQAQRVDRIAFVKRINEKIEKKHYLKNIVSHYKGQELIFDSSIMETISSDKRANIINDIKLCVLEEPGIKNAWVYDDLVHMPTQVGTLEDNIKNQLFRGRSGSIIIQVEPYTLMTHSPTRTSHNTPYDYDTHVPLIVFHPGKFERRHVRKRVTVRQLANTLAEVINVPKPSASTCEILPDLFDPEYQ